jgi:hypothetical protein
MHPPVVTPVVAITLLACNFNNCGQLERILMKFFICLKRILDRYKILSKGRSTEQSNIVATVIPVNLRITSVLQQKMVGTKGI